MSKENNFVDTWMDVLSNMKSTVKRWFLKEDTEKKRPFEARFVYSFSNPDEASVLIYCKKDKEGKEYILSTQEFYEKFEQHEIEL